MNISKYYMQYLEYIVEVVWIRFHFLCEDEISEKKKCAVSQHFDIGTSTVKCAVSQHFDIGTSTVKCAVSQHFHIGTSTVKCAVPQHFDIGTSTVKCAVSQHFDIGTSTVKCAVSQHFHIGTSTVKSNNAAENEPNAASKEEIILNDGNQAWNREIDDADKHPQPTHTRRATPRKYVNCLIFSKSNIMVVFKIKIIKHLYEERLLWFPLIRSFELRI